MTPGLSTPPTLVGSCELDKPRQSAVFIKPSLRTDNRGEGSKPVAIVIRQMLVIELTEPFLLAEPRRAGRG